MQNVVAIIQSAIHVQMNMKFHYNTIIKQGIKKENLI